MWEHWAIPMLTHGSWLWEQVPKAGLDTEIPQPKKRGELDPQEGGCQEAECLTERGEA